MHGRLSAGALPGREWIVAPSCSDTSSNLYSSTSVSRRPAEPTRPLVGRQLHKFLIVLLPLRNHNHLLPLSLATAPCNRPIFHSRGLSASRLEAANEPSSGAKVEERACPRRAMGSRSTCARCSGFVRSPRVRSRASRPARGMGAGGPWRGEQRLHASRGNRAPKWVATGNGRREERSSTRDHPPTSCLEIIFRRAMSELPLTTEGHHGRRRCCVLPKRSCC